MKDSFLKQSHEKYLLGDALTDEELRVVYKYYKTLNNALMSCWTEKYALMAHDVYSNLLTLEGYINSRKNTRA